MAQPNDNYLNTASIPDIFKPVFNEKYILIDSVEELEKIVKDITSGKKYCELYTETNSTYTQVSITQQIKTGKRLEGVWPRRKKVTYTETLYIVNGDNNNTLDAESLYEKGIYRKPIFSKFNSTTEYTGTESSFCMGGIQNVDVDVDTQKEQKRVLDDNVLIALAPLRTQKSIFLYAKDVKSQKYSKVSLTKEAQDVPVPTIYINEINNKTRSSAEKDEKDKLQAEIDLKTSEIKAINDATNDSLNVCAALSSQSMLKGVDAKTLDKNKKKATDKIQKVLDVAKQNMTDFPTYLKSVLTYGKTVTREDFNKNYVLIISTTEWKEKLIPLVEGNQPPVGTAAPQAAEEVSVATETVEPPKSRGFLGTGLFAGGRRKTKKSNKKSRKGKSKKQNKSRKVFFY